MSDAQPPADSPPAREEHDDLDLLTYGEAGVRLHDEVRAQEHLVGALQASGGHGLEAAQARLALLREAVERNKRRSINDDNFERFFGYRGSALRNT
jgi:hypothetical protein